MAAVHRRTVEVISSGIGRRLTYKETVS